MPKTEQKMEDNILEYKKDYVNRKKEIIIIVYECF